MARIKFNWTYKGGVTSTPDGVKATAYAVIEDYIKKNKHKTAEQLRSDLNVFDQHKIGWDGKGTRPITLQEKVQTEGYYFSKKFRLGSGEVIRVSQQCWGATNTVENFWNEFKNQMVKLGYTIEDASSEKGDTSGGRAVASQRESQGMHILEEFKQIILYGPPGTGKTYCAKTEILPQILSVDEDKVDDEQGKRWDIVQFHPSYNYEDFVRGVTAKTTGNNVAYKTVNRTFGDICERAGNDSGKKYALIIDEINRANVSAVLGELIYALEYRGKKIKTPYTIDGAKDSMLVIPKNLYIIGTMNTADRTIGQIDYAVRRRFAFVQCLPKESVITDKKAREAFSLVDKIFDKEKRHMSPDYDADDVRVGHSYFLLKPNENLAYKIIYQVVPILREYVKDGVLLKSAENEISAIEKEFSGDVKISNGLEEATSGDSSEEGSRGNPFYCWEKDRRFGINNIGRTVLSITQDYVKHNPEKTLKELQEWFPDRGNAQNRGIKSESEVVDRDRFFNKEEDTLVIDGKAAYVTSQWMEKKIGGSEVGSLEGFKEDVKDSGYVVSRCHVVNIQEIDKKRSWDACWEFGYVSGSGVKENGQLRTIGLRKIEKDDIVFALLLTDSDGNKGFIGMGKVLKEAVPIKQFKVERIPILNCMCKDGQKYRKKYPVAAECANDEQKREWMVSVKWLHVLQRKDVEGSSTPGHVTFSRVSSSNLKIIKAKFEKDK